ncbi:hypothetical protein MTO96_026327 [Rhipicephalus appendiculatus]
MVYRTDTSCDFTGVTIDDEVFSRLIAKIPENMESGPQGYHTLLPGFEIGGLTAVGVNKLQKLALAMKGASQLGPTSRALPCNSAWWTPDASGVKLEYYSALPVDRQAIRISVDGAGRGVRGAFEILSMLMPSFMEEIWTMEFMRNINRAFREFSE